MIQVILKDGTKKRFTKYVTDISRDNPIEWMKELTKEEELMIPKKINGEWQMVNPEPISKENVKKIKKQRIELDLLDLFIKYDKAVEKKLSIAKDLKEQIKKLEQELIEVN